MFLLDAANIQLFARGAWIAVSVFSVTMALSLVLGIPLGIIAARSKRRSKLPLRRIIDGFSFVFRGVPLIVQILYIYYGSAAFGIRPTRFLGAVIAFTGFATSSVLEIVRAGVNSVPIEQWMAAQSLGMSQTRVLRYVILPQAMRVVIPPVIGFAAQLIKSTSIVSLIGLLDVTFAGGVVASRTGTPLLVYLLVGATYFILVYPISKLGEWLERRTAFTS